MKSIKILLAGLVVLVVVFASSCGEKKQTETYYLISVNTQLPYWRTVANGFTKAAASHQVYTKIAGPESYDPLGELDALQRAVQAKPAGILISVADASVLEREIDNAVKQGIPVIAVDSDARITRRITFIGTNNVDAGRLGAARLIEKLGGKGNVVFFTIPGQPNLEERLSGFKQDLERYPGVKIAGIADIKGGATDAFDQAQQYLARTGPEKIAAFVCLEAVSGKPVADAVKRVKKGPPLVIAWDTDQGTLDAVRDGTIDATIAQKPYTMGFFGLKMLYDVVHAPPPLLNKDFHTDFFSPYPAYVDTGTVLVDKSNVDLYFSAQAANK
jgi:ribose transport system substrate-binding protein